MTTIQQVAAVSAAINGGSLYKPYILKRIVDTDSDIVVKESKEEKVRKVISEESSSLVRYALESVVANGTGRNAYIENYRVGGKTGTAQKVQNGAYMVGNYIVSFIGFMPADDPEVVIYVAIDNPKGVTQYGGTVAAPAAKNILTEVADILDIEPSLDGMPKVYQWMDTKYKVLPNVVGMSLKDAQNTLKDFKIVYSGEGETVTYQSPREGQYVKEGGTVKILLN